MLIDTRQCTRQAQRQLAALAEFWGIPVRELGGIILERGIVAGWEGYRENPKHRAQIAAWEKENANAT